MLKGAPKVVPIAPLMAFGGALSTLYALIHPSAWKRISANFAYAEFSEVPTRDRLAFDPTAVLAERGGIRTPDAVSPA